MTDICIGITDAEMRVYVEYMEEMEYINQKIFDTLLDKHAFESLVNTSSVIKLGVKNPGGNFHEKVLDYIDRNDEFDDILSDYREMYNYRANFVNRIDDKLKLLDEDTVKLLAYRYLDGLTYEEIAEKTFSNRQTVYERLHKILKFQLS